jgi:hypothetical protein
MLSWECSGWKDNCRSDVFGLKAVVQEQKMSALKVLIHKVKPDGMKDDVVYHCSVDEVMEWKDDEREEFKKKSMTNLSDGEKRFQIKQIWGNDKGNYGGTLPGRMLEDTDLMAIHEYLQWQYMEPNIALVKPAVAKVVAVEGHSHTGGSACIAEIQDYMKTKKIVVIPVHSDSGPHWTALVLEMQEIGSLVVKKVWYFDWVKPLVASNRNYARKILRLITCRRLGTMATSVEFPEVKNRFRQREGSNDCGFVVWYCLEVFMKRMRLEGEWKLCPDPAKWRTQLKTFETSLVKQQADWIMEDAGAKKKKTAAEIICPGNKSLGAIVDAAGEKKEVDKKVKAGALKTKAKDFYTCGRCRWTMNGEGCDSCNPEKAEKTKLQKLQQSTQIQNAVAEWYAALAKAGITPEHVPADQELVVSEGKLTGGGIHLSICSSNGSIFSC